MEFLAGLGESPHDQLLFRSCDELCVSKQPSLRGVLQRNLLPGPRQPESIMAPAGLFASQRRKALQDLTGMGRDTAVAAPLRLLTHAPAQLGRQRDIPTGLDE